ncbi:MAG: FHA domain-containing protein [Candidatus Dadabacteria bacterium]|nr:MAG: FHA domain-containing protein [Candidatus Dadabacteria bacterium]
MFALELKFQDGVSRPETVFVRRPQALIGASDYAHVVVEDMRELDYQLRITRQLGRSFICKPVPVREGVKLPDIFEGVYQGEAAFDLGPVQVLITSLDIDLTLKDSEPPDRAGVRVLRQACATSSPRFPAVVVAGAPPIIVSFVPDQPIYIGRSRECALRLDTADISARHARLGYESGMFWIEDLGSTNGTFVEQQQISGRVDVQAGAPIALGAEVVIYGITSDAELHSVISQSPSGTTNQARPESRTETYPVVVSTSEVARPARLVLPVGEAITIGRDPSSDMWLGAPHVSRKHCSLYLTKTGLVTVNDFSTNGTAHDTGVLKRGDTLEIRGTPKVLNFGGGITVGICFNSEQEQSYIDSHGSPEVFSSIHEAPVIDNDWGQSKTSSTLSDMQPLQSKRRRRDRRGTGMIMRVRNAYYYSGTGGKFIVILTLLVLFLAACVLISLLVPILSRFLT